MAIINNTLSDHLTYLEETKEQIKQALIDKGQQINDTKPFRGYVDNINNLGTAQLYNNIDEMNASTSVVNGSIGIVYDINNNNFQGLYYYNKNQYEPAKTQFEAIDEDVMEVPYFGKNGVSVGNLNSIKYINENNKMDIFNFYNKIFPLFTTFDMSNITMAPIIKTNFKQPYFKFTNLSNAINMYYMFWGCNNLYIVEGLNSQKESTINIKDFSKTFERCYNLQFLNFNNSYLNNLTSMENMCYNCQNLSYVDLSSTNMASLESLYSTFTNCNNLRLVNFTNTNCYVKSWAETFSNCSNLVNLPGVFYNYNFFKEATVLYNTFKGCLNLRGELKINNASNIVNMSNMIAGSNIALNILNSDLQNCVDMTALCRTYNTVSIYNSNFPLNLVNNTTFEKSLATRVNLCNLNYIESENNPNLSNLFREGSQLNNIQMQTLNNADSNFYIHNFNNASNMFFGCKNLKSITINVLDFTKCYDYSQLFYNCSNLVDASLFCSNIIYNNFDIIQNVNTYRMFYNCINIINIRMNKGFLNTGTLTNCSQMFYNCYNMKDMPNPSEGGKGCWLNIYNFVNCENTSQMFYNCSNLSALWSFADRHMGNLNLNNCINSSGMFYNCSNLILDPKQFGNFAYLQDTSNMFTKTIFGLTTHYKADYKLSLNLSNMVNIINCKQMFYNINTICLNSFNVDWCDCNLINLTDASNMFACTKLTSLNMVNISAPDTANMDTFIGQGNATVEYLNIINCNLPLSNIANIHKNNLIAVNLSNSNLHKVNISRFFNFATNLGYIDISNSVFNTYDCINLFVQCVNLAEIKWENTHFQPRSTYQMFVNLPKITNLDFKEFDFSICTNTNLMISNCVSLHTITNITNANFASINNFKNLENMFINCPNLVNIDISNWNLSNINIIHNTSYLFFNCKNLSNESIDSIINMCLNWTSLDPNYRSVSRLYSTGCNISNTRYENRWAELDAAGWTY